MQRTTYVFTSLQVTAKTSYRLCQPTTVQRILKIWIYDATQCLSNWCTESDTFRFRIELRDKPATRRGIVSTISSVYDPLGAVSPVILVGKQILQALCLQNVSWDDPIPEDILPLWEKWRTELPLLKKLMFPRSLKPMDFGDPVQTEIHSFSDASNSGIGQISYLRIVNHTGEVHVSYLPAKSSRSAEANINSSPCSHLCECSFNA